MALVCLQNKLLEYKLSVVKLQHIGNIDRYTVSDKKVFNLVSHNLSKEMCYFRPQPRKSTWQTGENLGYVATY